MRLFIVFVFSLLSFNFAFAIDNFATLEKQAHIYKRQLEKKSKKKSIEPANRSALSDSAYYLYSNKECRLASNIQRKLISYKPAISAFDWYRLSLYTSCNHDSNLASKAIFLAWENEQQQLQKHRYKVMLADYLFSIKQLKSSWNADLTNLYQQLINAEQSNKLQNQFRDKIAQLKQIREQANQLIFSNARSKTDNGRIKICLDVNLSGYWDNAENRAVKLQDYFRFKPKFSPSFERNYNELCVLGAKWSSDYQLEILKGLKIESKVLGNKLDFNIKTDSRPSDFWFKRSRYILPKNNTAQVPVYAVNTDKIHVALYRILPDNLQNTRFLNYFKNSISNYDLREISDQLGNKIWSGDVLLNSEQAKDKSNQDKASLDKTGLDKTIIRQIPLPEQQMQKSGVYIVVAAEKEEHLDNNKGYQNLAAQWLVVSDIGLTSYKSRDGIIVMAHSLETGKSLDNLALSLYSRNNSLLAKELTDLNGKAVFDSSVSSGENGMQAMQILASHPEYGFLFYPLKRAGFDLSDRGVSGRVSLSEIEAYLYTERGIYRPGETVNLVALLRDKQAQAIQGLPLTLKISNPDGRVIREQLLQDKAAGGYAYDFKLPMAIRTGYWQFEVFADVKAAALGSLDFLVEEIKPPRLQATLKSDELPVTPIQDKQFKLQADYLFGAPGANLNINTNISYQHNRSPFKDYSDFVFGTDDKKSHWSEQISRLGSYQQGKTDSKGNYIVDLKLSPQLKIKQPLSGLLRAEVIDVDGTMVAVEKKFAVRNMPLYIGIGKSFSSRAPENQDFDLKLVTLDENGKNIRKQGLSWQLIREESYYQWFKKHGNWSYEKIVEEHPEKQGVIVSRQQDIELLKFKLAQGQYRLEVADKQSSIVSSYRFVVGEQIDSINDLPDVVKLSLDKPAYQSGDEVELTIDSPYTGEADIIIADNSIHSILKLHLTEKQSKIKLPVNKSWGVGTYALVSVYRGESKPVADNDGQMKSPELAKRAMGVIWINRDKTPYKFNVKIDSPARVKPAQTVEIPVYVENITADDIDDEQQIYLTLAAVDLGVLDLTNYKSPDPLDYFLAKRRLETQINDNYARLIDNLNGKPARLREGGDTMMESSRASMPAKNIKIASLFSGILKLHKHGKAYMAKVSLDIPDFNGQLKLMAVAWSKKRSGAAQKNIYITDDIVVQTSLPRFLSNGDQAKLSVLLHNLHADSGQYRLQLKTDPLLQTLAPDLASGTDNTSVDEIEFSLTKGQSVNQSFNIKAVQAGNAQLSLRLIGENNFLLEKQYNIGIRGISLPKSEQSLQKLPGNSDLLISQQDLSAYEAHSASTTVSVSSGVNLGVYGLLEKLDRYPHGCLEQLTSRAMPLLSVDVLSQRWNYPEDPMLDSRINEAIALILDKQRYDGSFGLWSANDHEESWLSFYAMEFLIRAANKSYRIPEFFIQRGLKWVKQYINKTSPEQDKQLGNLAYAHYILALTGQGNIEESRYLAKQYAANLPTLLSYAQLAKALQLMGEDALAIDLQDSIDVLHFKRLLNWQDYGSQLRDMAAAASLFDPQSSAYQKALSWVNQVVNSPKSKNHRKYLSTQEQAWLIRLALTLGQDKPLSLSLDGKPIAEGKSETTLKYDFADLAASRQISNLSAEPIWVSTSLYGEPKTVTAYQNGFKISKTLYDEQGNKVDLQNIKQGQRLIMLIKGKATSGLFQRGLIVDMLPAGLEAENANVENSFDMQSLSWLPKLSATRYVEALDDRFVAALDISSGKNQKFAIAYPLRAITQGTFNFPPVYIEDMYQPYFRANTSVDKLQVIGQ